VLTFESVTASHLYSTTGTKIIAVSDMNGCYGYDTVVSSFSVGILQNTLSTIKIHPNPANNELFIESPDFAIEHLEIVDVTGKQLQDITLQPAHQANLNISTLSNGVYIINATYNGVVYRSRFIKAK